MQALYTAATGMEAQETNVELLANNIANMRTAGFKRQRAEFQDLLYQQSRRIGSFSSQTGTIMPSGVEIGSGVKVAATPRIMTQGNLLRTDKELDLAIKDRGYFQVNLPDGQTGYTRDGSFERNAEGMLVNADGHQVVPGVTIPDDARGLNISADGTVSAYIGNGSSPTILGQITLARFTNRSGLLAIGDNLFLETASSGTPQTGVPGSEGFGSVLQKHLELSNVSPVIEISELIAAQRAYEMNARVIRSSDEMLSATSNIR